MLPQQDVLRCLSVLEDLGLKVPGLSHGGCSIWGRGWVCGGGWESLKDAGDMGIQRTFDVSPVGAR